MGSLMHQSTNRLAVCLAGLVLSLFVQGVVRAQGTEASARALLLPQGCPLVVEVEDLPAVLHALKGARRLFTSGPVADDDTAAVEGDVVEWSPSEALAGALVHALCWPHGERVRTYFAALIAATPDCIGVGWVPTKRDGLAPVVVVKQAPVEHLDPPSGTLTAAVRGYLIIASEQCALDRVRAHLNASARLAAEPARTSAGCRMWLHPRLLLDRMHPGSVSAFASLRHFLVDWPRRISIEWRAGHERIRVEAPRLAGRLGPTAAIPAPRYVSCSIRWAGRLALPEGLEGLADLLERDPLGIGAAVVRSWPASTPERDVIARHLSGRFQMLLVRSNGSFTPVPVVGLEMVSAKRGVALLDRLLVASGLCDRLDDKPAPYTYVRRLPAELRSDSRLVRILRFYGPQWRQYGLGVAGNWLWLGPMDEVKQVMRSSRSETVRLAAAVGDEPTDGPFRAGELDIDAFALWEHLDFQHLFISRDSTRRDATEERMRQTMGELAGVMRRPVFVVERDGQALLLSREASLADSLFSFLAARSSRFHAEIELAQADLRREVRVALTALLGAQAIFRRLKGKYAGSVAELTRAGLWRAQENPARSAIELGVRAAGTAFVVFALPRDAALGQERFGRAYAMRADGVLLVGPRDLGGIETLLGAERNSPAWRRVAAE